MGHPAREAADLRSNTMIEKSRRYNYSAERRAFDLHRRDLDPLLREKRERRDRLGA
jgi:hypothetical protein